MAERIYYAVFCEEPYESNGEFDTFIEQVSRSYTNFKAAKKAQNAFLGDKRYKYCRIYVGALYGDLRLKFELIKRCADSNGINGIKRSVLL